MMAVNTLLNAKAVQGESIILQFSVLDEDGLPISLTGKSISWRLKDSISKELKLTKTLASGITILLAPNDHKFEVSLSSTDTSELIGKFNHEATVIDGLNQNVVKNSDNSHGVIEFREAV